MSDKIRAKALLKEIFPDGVWESTRQETIDLIDRHIISAEQAAVKNAYKEFVNHKLDTLESENRRLREACQAVDIYFKALNEQWNANDGRVVSESGVVLEGSADVERLCNEAAWKVKSALHPKGEK